MESLNRSLIGEMLGDYEIVEKVGSGGMANVFKAVHSETKQSVAIKLIHPFLLEDRVMVGRFEREAAVMARLEHPNIVKTYAFHSDEDENHYLVMEYVEGASLKALLESDLFGNGRDHLAQTIDIISQVAQAVGYAHQHQMVHRDIKPGNIMLTPEGRVVLMDFGIVKLLDQTSAMTVTGSLLGTPAYMSPEQALGEPGDTRGDIYALGVVLFQLVTGELPFDAETPMGVIMKHVSEPPPLPGALNPATPLSLHNVIWKAMEKDPYDRFQTAVSLIDALQEVDLSSDAPSAPTRYDFQIGSEQKLDTLSSPLLPTPYQFPPRIPNFSQRDKTVGKVVDRLSDGSKNQILGLVGFGGVGKTAVAIHAIRQLRHIFTDGILWAQLDYSSPEAELVKIADAYGQTEAVSKKYTLPQKSEFIRQILANKKVLLVLDNVQDSEQLRWLMPNGRKNAVLITTRNHKMLQSIDAQIVTVNPFSENEAVEYLASVIGADRVLRERSVAKELGRLTGGLPLALSIVASLLNEAEDLSIAEYTDLLRDEKTRLANLTDWEDATRDVAASFELSYQTLPVPLQHLFASLAVFDGPDFAARDVAIISKMPPVQAKLGLGRLHSLSLIGTGLGERELELPLRLADKGRYQINPLLRAFAREKLVDKYDLLRKRSAEYFANMASLNTSFDNFSRLDLEWQNIFGALSWAYQNQQWEPLLMGTLALTNHQFGNYGFMDARGLWNQAMEMLGWALNNPGNSELVQIRLVNRLAAFAIKLSDWEKARMLLQSTQAMLQSKGKTLDYALETAVLYDLHHRLAQQNDQQEALSWIEQGLKALAPFVDSPALHEQARLHIEKSKVLLKLGEFEEAIEAAQIGLNLLPTDPTPTLISGYLNLAIVHYYQGDLKQSIQLLLLVIPLAERMQDFHRSATAAMNLGIMQEQLGQFRRASRNYLKSLRLYKALGDNDNEGSSHINLGSLYIKLGEDEKAKEHLETAVSIAKQFHLEELELFAYTCLADFYLHQKQWEAAQNSVEQIEEMKEAVPSYLLPSLHRVRATIVWHQGNVKEARRLVSLALSAAEDGNYVLEQGMCWRLIGDMRHHEGDEKADEAYQNSLRLLADQGPYELARSQLAYAQYLLTKGERETAVALLKKAKDTFEQLATRREQKLTLDILSANQ